MPEAQRVIIVHTLAQAMVALETAHALHTPLTLQSAPDALHYAGSLYLLRMFERAKQAFPAVEARLILDCSDAGAEAIGAIQAGHRHIRSHAPEPLRTKIRDIAMQYGAEMIENAHEALDLHRAMDTKGASMQWLRGETL